MKFRTKLLREVQQSESVSALSAFLEQARTEYVNTGHGENSDSEANTVSQLEFFEYDCFYRRIGVL
jgi:hypothetical protein